jgi:hypothetical protein
MEIRKPIDLLDLEAFADEKYDQIALTSLTSYSTYWLSQWGLQTSLENLAVLNFKLFPTKFAMVGWPQFPDFNRTNRSVLQMRPKYRNLATSIAKKGVFLNEQGIQEAQALVNRLGSPRFRDGSTPSLQFPISPARGPHRARTIHPEDQIAKLKSSRLFELYQNGHWAEAEAIDLVNFLEVYDHTPSKEKLRRLRDFQQAAEELKDRPVGKFLDEVLLRFKSYLHR